MKRILTALLLLLSATATATAYVNTDTAERSIMEHATVTLGQPLVIPNNPQLADPEQMYSALQGAATEARVNVFRTAFGYNQDNRPQSAQYVLLTTKTHLFDAFGLKKGRWLASADSKHSERFLSTIETRDPNQAGVLRDFGSNDLFDIRGLRAAFDSLPVAGNYVVESSTPGSYERFLKLLAQKSNRLGGGASSLVSADFKGSQVSFTGITTDNSWILDAVQYLIVVLTAMLLAYRVLHGAKMAGVMRLHGFGTVRIWYNVAGRLILVVLAASGAVALLATRLVPDSTAEFTVSVSSALLRAFVIMLCASLVTCAYIASTKVSDSIKNRKDTRGIFALNTIIKAVCSIVLIAVGAGLWLQYSNVAAERNKLGNWDKTRGYGVFYPKNVGNDLMELQTGQVGSTVAEIYDLYPKLNKMGALFIDSSNYQPAALAEPSAPGDIRSIQINPNYLKQFPLRDASGQKIQVSEQTSNWVVLAPVKFKPRQAQLLEYFKSIRIGSVASGTQTGKDTYGHEVSARVVHQKIRIVWIKNDQRVFSFDPLVYPENGNVIVDPVIQVMSSANSLGIDRANSFSGGANSALKVRLLEGDTSATLKMLSPTLKRLKLDDNLRNLVTMDDYALGRIKVLEEGMRNVAIAAIAIGIGLLVLVMQSLTIMFERYSRKIVVRRLFGLGLRRRYREFLLVALIVSIIQLLGALAANRAGLSPFSTPTFKSVAADKDVVAIGSIVTVVEVVFSVAVLILIEKRNMIKVLKGDF